MAHRSYLDYQLLDSGNKQRLESVGGYTIVRPCSTATWKPSHPDAWQKAATTSQPLFWTTTYNCPLIQPLTLQLEKRQHHPKLDYSLNMNLYGNDLPQQSHKNQSPHPFLIFLAIPALRVLLLHKREQTLPMLIHRLTPYA
jgi:hypothetical protein